MPQDYQALLAEVESLSVFFQSLPLKQQYEFHRQVYGTMPLRTAPLWRSMVKIAQRIKQECEDERRKVSDARRVAV